MVLTVVVPAYKCSQQILGVIESLPTHINYIVVVDDCCPEMSGDLVEKNIQDTRVIVLKNKTNLGVGGAVISGYKKALELGSDIVIKMDGDGQMDPNQIENLIKPLREQGGVGYVKGNRFFDIDGVKSMPKIRIFGNLALTFITKLSSGYYQIFDPNNGFTAIKANTLRQLDLDKIDQRYFFESDMLFRLGLIRTQIIDVAMPAKYANEKSNLVVYRILFEFLRKHLRNFFKRIFYNYYLRDFSLASIELPLGLGLCTVGASIGMNAYLDGLSTGNPSNAGTVTLVSMCLILGFQLLLQFIQYDILSSPTSRMDHIRS